MIERKENVIHTQEKKSLIETKKLDIAKHNYIKRIKGTKFKMKKAIFK